MLLLKISNQYIFTGKACATILALHNAVRCPQGFQGRFLRLGFLFALLCFLFALLSDLRAFGFVLPQGAPVTRVNLTRPFESRFFIEWSASNSPLPTYAIHRNGSGTHSINTAVAFEKAMNLERTVRLRNRWTETKRRGLG